MAATTRIFAQVIDVTGRRYYYNLPDDFQTQCRDLDARAAQIWKEKSCCCNLWTFAFLLSAGMTMPGLIFTILDEDKRFSLPLLIIGLLGMCVSLRCINRYQYNEAGEKFNALRNAMKQNIIKVHSNYQAEHKKYGITSIDRIPDDSEIITISWEREPSITWEEPPERVSSLETTERSVLLELEPSEEKRLT